MATIEVEFLPGDLVVVEKEILARVVEVSVVAGRTLYRVSWLNNGKLELEYIDRFMLDGKI